MAGSVTLLWTANNGYRFNGIPDGVGVIDNGNTLRIVVNHELGATAGAVRAHGSIGAYVSDLLIDKATLAVISGGDFLKSAADLPRHDQWRRLDQRKHHRLQPLLLR